MLYCVHGLRADLKCPHAPVDVFSLAETLRIDVRREALGNPGLLIQRRDGSFEIRVDSGMPLERQRFTVAHELGHYLMFRHMPKEMVGSTLEDHDPEEEYLCDVAAAEMLMPMKGIRASLRQSGLSANTVFALARQYAVSRQAMMRRLCVALSSEARVDCAFVLWRADGGVRLIAEWQAPGDPAFGTLANEAITRLRSWPVTEGRVEGEGMFIVGRAQQLRKYAAWRYGSSCRWLTVSWRGEAPMIQRYLG